MVQTKTKAKDKILASRPAWPRELNITTTIFIWEKATRLPERAQAHQSWPPKSQIRKMQYMHRKTYRTEIC